MMRVSWVCLVLCMILISSWPAAAGPAPSPAAESSPAAENSPPPDSPDATPEPEPSPKASPKASPSPSKKVQQILPPYAQFPEKVPIHFTGYVQGQANAGSLHAVNATTHFPETNGIGIFPANTDLEIRRLRVGLQGDATKDLFFNLESNYESRTGRPTLINAYIDLRLQKNLMTSVGTFKTRFGIEGLRNDYLGDIIELSDVTNCLYRNRDIGVNMQVRSGNFIFNAGAYNGEGQRISSFEIREYIGKLNYLVTKDLYVGMSADYGKTIQPTASLAALKNVPFVSPTPAPVKVVAAAPKVAAIKAAVLPPFTTLPTRKYGFEFHYEKTPWLVEGEYIASTGFNSFAKNVAPAAGWYLRGVYTVAAPLDLLIHYDQFDPDQNVVNDLVADNRTNGRGRFVLGANYYFDRKMATRIMVDYEWHNQLQGARYDTSGWRVRYQWRF